MGTPPGTPPPEKPPEEQSTRPGFVFEHGRLVTFKSKHVEPPPQLYFTPDDRLGIDWITTVPGAVLQVGARILQPDGKITLFQYTVQPVVVGQWNFSSFPLTEGFLLSLLAESAGAHTQRGQMFAQVIIQTGGVISGGFLNGYISDTQPLAWPLSGGEDGPSGAGFIKKNGPANPAAGTGFTYTIPNNLIADLRSVLFTLVTNATAANRFPQIVWQDVSGRNLALVQAAVAQTATQTVNYTFARGVAELQAAAVNGELLSHLAEVRLIHNDKIILQVANMAAGDQISNLALETEEWVVDATL